MGFMLIPVLKPARTSNIFFKDWFPGQAVHADNIRAGEVCSAEATELPFWERPVVSVANGLCHPWGTGSRFPRFTQIYGDKRRRFPRIGVMGCGFGIWCLFQKDWIPGRCPG